jgi:hypothetical protein
MALRASVVWKERTSGSWPRTTTRLTVWPWNTPTSISMDARKEKIVIVVATVGIEWRSKMDNSFNFNEDLNNVLMELVQKDKITMGVNEEGEFIFWMTDEQKAAYYEENGYE